MMQQFKNTFLCINSLKPRKFFRAEELRGNDFWLRIIIWIELAFKAIVIILSINRAFICLYDLIVQ